MSILRTTALLAFTHAGLCLQTAAGQAQASRTWVSGVGDDANPCSRTAPCKTFAGAISKTAASGEINVLDPGGFGGVTITKSITIRSEIQAGVLVAGTNGIVVSAAATDKIVLEGLDIQGLGTPGGSLSGVKMIGGGSLTIRKCSIAGFIGSAASAGVDVQGTLNAREFVEDSMIINNSIGVNMKGIGGVANRGFVERTLIDANGVAAIQIDGPSSVVLIGSTLTGSAASIAATNGAQVISYGNNVIRNSGAPTSTVPLQ